MPSDFLPGKTRFSSYELPIGQKFLSKKFHFPHGVLSAAKEMYDFQLVQETHLQNIGASKDLPATLEHYGASERQFDALETCAICV